MTQLTQVMQFLLPFILVFVTIFIAWQFAAGLALYRAASLLLNMISQYFVTGWGSLLTIPNFAGLTGDGGVQRNVHVQQTQLSLKSAKRHAQGKGASARRRGKASKKKKR